MARRGATPLAKTEDKEQLFALKYIEHRFNGKQAAMAIGIPPAGAAVEASRFLNSPKVQEVLKQEMDLIVHRSRLNIDIVVEEIRNIGFSSIGDFITVGEDGQPFVDMSKATPEQLATLAEINVTEETTGGGEREERTIKKTRLKMHSKLDALTKLLMYLGAFNGKALPPGGTGEPGGITNYNFTQINMGDKTKMESDYFRAMKEVKALVVQK